MCCIKSPFSFSLSVTSLCPVKVPVGGWWRLSDCCHYHKHCSKTTHVHSHSSFLFSVYGYERLSRCMCLRSVTTGRQCCSASWCVRRERSGASRWLRLSVKDYYKTHTQLWIRCVCVCVHSTKYQTVSTDSPHDVNFFVFNVLCVCLDRPPPPAVWPVSPGAARRGQVTASGGEVHPGKLPWGTGRHTEMTRQTVVMQTRCRHRELTCD